MRPFSKSQGALPSRNCLARSKPRSSTVTALAASAFVKMSSGNSKSRADRDSIHLDIGYPVVLLGTPAFN